MHYLKAQTQKTAGPRALSCSRCLKDRWHGVSRLEEDSVTEEPLWSSGEVMGRAWSQPLGKKVGVWDGATVSPARYPHVFSCAPTSIDTAKTIYTTGYDLLDQGWANVLTRGSQWLLNFAADGWSILMTHVIEEKNVSWKKIKALYWNDPLKWMRLQILYETLFFPLLCPNT